MTIRSIFISAIFISTASFAQSRRFLERVDNAKPCYYAESTASAQRLDLLNFDAHQCSGFFISALNHQREFKSRTKLEQDSLLNRIATAGIESYNNKNYRSSITWQKDRGSIKFALQKYHSKNRIYVAHAFRLDLLDLDLSKSFYLDRRIGESELNLYLGKRPKENDPEDKDYVEPVPLNAITEQILAERLIKLMSSGEMEKDFLSKKYSRIGIAVKVDKKSLNAAKRPQLFVIVIYGGKLLQEIKVPQDVTNG